MNLTHLIAIARKHANKRVIGRFQSFEYERRAKCMCGIVDLQQTRPFVHRYITLWQCLSLTKIYAANTSL